MLVSGLGLVDAPWTALPALPLIRTIVNWPLGLAMITAHVVGTCMLLAVGVSALRNRRD